MSLTMVHTGNGNITHSSNQRRLSRRGSMGINYTPYISLVFMPHVRRGERMTVQIKHQPSKGWPASPTRSQNSSSSTLPTAQTHAHTYQLLQTVVISTY